MKCECNCGNDAQVIHREILSNDRYLLCSNCLLNFVMTALTKKQFFSLLKNGHTTKEFMLHSDFYDETTGEALQPKW